MGLLLTKGIWQQEKGKKNEIALDHLNRRHLSHNFMISLFNKPNAQFFFHFLILIQSSFKNYNSWKYNMFTFTEGSNFEFIRKLTIEKNLPEKIMGLI